MKIIHRDIHHAVIRLDTGEEFISSLTRFAEEEEIRAATCTAIGACGEVTISFYDLQKKIYLDHTSVEDLEIVSLMGNIAMLSGKPFVHAHGVFGKADYSTIAGHIKSMNISATCEIMVSILNGEMHRAHDEETGLNLLT